MNTDNRTLPLLAAGIVLLAGCDIDSYKPDFAPLAGPSMYNAGDAIAVDALVGLVGAYSERGETKFAVVPNRTDGMNTVTIYRLRPGAEAFDPSSDSKLFYVHTDENGRVSFIKTSGDLAHVDFARGTDMVVRAGEVATSAARLIKLTDGKLDIRVDFEPRIGLGLFQNFYPARLPQLRLQLARLTTPADARLRDELLRRGVKKVVASTAPSGRPHYTFVVGDTLYLSGDDWLTAEALASVLLSPVPGPAGPAGPGGVAGPPGPPGQNGSPGPAGPTGPAGPSGPVGPRGPEGTPAPPGTSSQPGPQGPTLPEGGHGERGGGGCTAAGSSSAAGLWLLAIALALPLARRRRHRAR